MIKEKAIEYVNGQLDMAVDDADVMEDEMYEALQTLVNIAGQKPILDKIRAEIDRQQKWLMSAGYNAYNVDIAFNSIKLVLSESEDKE